MSLSDTQVRERVEQVEALLERVEGISDAAAREAALDTVQALLDLYGEGLSRIIGHVADQCRGATHEDIAKAFADDELVSHLMLLHGLHPAGHLSITAVEQPPVLVPLRRAHSAEPAEVIRQEAEAL